MKTSPGSAEFLVLTRLSGTILWVNLIDDIHVRVRPVSQSLSSRRYRIRL